MDTRALMEDVFGALSKGDARPLVAALSDDARWSIRGKTRWSRAYEGRRAVVGELFTMLQQAVVDRIVTVPDRILVDGDTAVVLAHGVNTCVDGRPYENEYCFVVEVRDGKIVSIDEYTDTLLVDEVLGPLVAP